MHWLIIFPAFSLVAGQIFKITFKIAHSKNHITVGIKLLLAVKFIFFESHEIILIV